MSFDGRKNLLQIMVFLSNGTRVYKIIFRFEGIFPGWMNYKSCTSGQIQGATEIKFPWRFYECTWCWDDILFVILVLISRTKPKILSSPSFTTVTIHIGNEYKPSMNLDSHCHPVLNDLRIYWAVSSNNIWRVKSLLGLSD